MGLSDAEAIARWLREQGRTDEPPAHEWIVAAMDAGSDGDDRSIRAVCRVCGLIRRKPISLNAEMFIDLSGPCPHDSRYWRELQEERARARHGTEDDG